MKLTILRLLFVTGLLSFALARGAAISDLPKFEPDPYWPKHLPNNWILGQVSGVAVDLHDNIWVIHRPRTTDEHDKRLLAEAKKRASSNGVRSGHLWKKACDRYLANRPGSKERSETDYRNGRVAA
jgi:hypothetical protein